MQCHGEGAVRVVVSVDRRDVDEVGQLLGEIPGNLTVLAKRDGGGKSRGRLTL